MKGFEYFYLKVIEKRIRERLAKSVRGETDAATVRRKLKYLYRAENTGFKRKPTLPRFPPEPCLFKYLYTKTGFRNPVA